MSLFPIFFFFINRLASYVAESSQVFVDILCDASAGMTCWVNGMNAGRCASVDNARVKHVACSVRKNFICMTQDNGENYQYPHA